MIVKCPKCGTPVSSSDSLCPECHCAYDGREIEQEQYGKIERIVSSVEGDRKKLAERRKKSEPFLTEVKAALLMIVMISIIVFVISIIALICMMAFNAPMSVINVTFVIFLTSSSIFLIFFLVLAYNLLVYGDGMPLPHQRKAAERPGLRYTEKDILFGEYKYDLDSELKCSRDRRHLPPNAKE